MTSILLVDDDAAHCYLLEMALQAHGYRVLIANCGATALELADQAGIAVVDMIMPGLTGLETIPLLRCSNPELKVIACSGSNEELFENELRELGVEHFLAKPFSIEDLVGKLELVAGDQPAG